MARSDRPTQKDGEKQKSTTSSVKQALYLADIDNNLFSSVIRDDDVSTLQQMLVFSKDVNTKINGKWAIDAAAEWNSWKCVELLLPHVFPTKEELKDPWKRYSESYWKMQRLSYVVFKAAKENKSELLKLFFSKPTKGTHYFFDGRWRDTKTGNNALHYAVINRNFDFLKAVTRCATWALTECNGGNMHVFIEIMTARNKQKQTYLDLMFALNYVDEMSEIASIGRGDSMGVKAVTISTLYKLLRSELITNYSDKRADKLLKFILSLPNEEEKIKALISALDVSKPFGYYFRHSKKHEYYIHKIHKYLEAVSQSEVNQDTNTKSLDVHFSSAQESSVDATESLLGDVEVRGAAPIYIPHDDFSRLFVSVPKHPISPQKEETKRPSRRPGLLQAERD